MLLKILGAIDILAGASYIIYHYGIITDYFILFYFGIFLLLKVVFFGFEFNFINIMDVFSALIILSAVFGTSPIIGGIALVWLVQKGLSSMI